MYIPDFWCGVIVGVVATLILAAAATIFKKRKKIKRHFNMWNEWRKDSLNSKLYKFLVLLRIKKIINF